MPLKPVMGGPTEVLNDEGIGHTAGTPVAGDVTLYWGVIWDVIDRRKSVAISRGSPLVVLPEPIIETERTIAERGRDAKLTPE
jgi:hypothetical protein